MFILLLLACAGAEWVEISQRHYRKPVRPNYNLPVVEKVTDVYFEDSTKAIRTYSNQTLEENMWERGNVNKVHKQGNVQRVQLHTNPVKAPNGRIDTVRINNKHLNSGNKDYRFPAGVTPGKVIDLENSFEYEYNLERSTENSAWISNKFNKKPESSNTANDKELSEIIKNSETEKRLVTTPTGFSLIKADLKDLSKMKDFNYAASFTTSATDIFTNIKQLQNPKTTSTVSKDISSINGNPSHTKYSNEEIEIIANDTKSYVSKSPIENTKVNKEPIMNDRHPADNPESNEHSTQNEKESNKPLKGDTLDTIGNLMQFVKAVADTIQKNTRRSVSSKTRYLQQLQETILNNIKERIDSAWPDDEMTSRRRRAAHVGGAATPRGHVQIPSSESALMTISFLTFAVFLIKLVLQVIQTYKNKTMMMAPAVVATVGRAAAAAGFNPSN